MLPPVITSRKAIEVPSGASLATRLQILLKDSVSIVLVQTRKSCYRLLILSQQLVITNALKLTAVRFHVRKLCHIDALIDRVYEDWQQKNLHF